MITWTVSQWDCFTIWLCCVIYSAAYRYAVYRTTGKNVTIRLPVCQNVWKRYIVSYHFTPKMINFGHLCNVVHTAHARRNNLTLKEVFLSIDCMSNRQEVYRIKVLCELWSGCHCFFCNYILTKCLSKIIYQLKLQQWSNLWQTEDR